MWKYLIAQLCMIGVSVAGQSKGYPEYRESPIGDGKLMSFPESSLPGAYLSPSVLEHIDKEQVSSIFEVGSRDALDAIRLSQYYKCHVFAFECNPECLVLCWQNAKHTPNVTIVDKAAWNEPGPIDFYPIAYEKGKIRDPGSSSCFRMTPALLNDFSQMKIKVPALRLDGWMKENEIDKADLVCISTQGASLKILQGMGSFLKKTKYIVTRCETETRYEGECLLPELAAFLKEHGFEKVATDLRYDSLFVNRNLDKSGKAVITPQASTPHLYPHHWSSLASESPDTLAIASLLKVYQTFDANGPITLRRIGRAYDGGYVIPETALRSADVIMGYGIGDDISFEDSSTAMYNKPSYGFDGMCNPVKPEHPDCHFIASCIGSESMAKEEVPGFASFNQHLNMIDAAGKKLFIKMDIEGGEYSTMPDILRHAQNITGIVLEVHFTNAAQIVQARDLMQMLGQDFLLVHTHGNNCCRDGFTTTNAIGIITRVLELTYINRSLVKRFEVSTDQLHPTSLDMPNLAGVADVAFIIRDY